MSAAAAIESAVHGCDCDSADARSADATRLLLAWSLPWPALLRRLVDCERCIAQLGLLPRLARVRWRVAGSGESRSAEKSLPSAGLVSIADVSSGGGREPRAFTDTALERCDPPALSGALERCDSDSPQPPPPPPPPPPGLGTAPYWRLAELCSVSHDGARDKRDERSDSHEHSVMRECSLVPSPNAPPWRPLLSCGEIVSSRCDDIDGDDGGCISSVERSSSE